MPSRSGLHILNPAATSRANIKKSHTQNEFSLYQIKFQLNLRNYRIFASQLNIYAVKCFRIFIISFTFRIYRSVEYTLIFTQKLSTIQSRPASRSFIDFEMIEGEWQKEDICIQIIAIIKRHRCYNECGTEDEDKNLYVNGLNE